MGASYERKLEGLDENLAFQRPLDNLHSVAEIISHLIFWREEAKEKILTGKGTKTDDDPGNWLSNNELKTMGWKSLMEKHYASLDKLKQSLRSRNDDFLREEYFDPDFKGMFTYQFLLDGMIHHDLYHLGQIGIIIKLLLKK